MYTWKQESSGPEESKEDETGPKLCSYVIMNYPFYKRNSPRVRGEVGGGTAQRILKDISHVFSLSFAPL